MELKDAMARLLSPKPSDPTVAQVLQVGKRRLLGLTITVRLRNGKVVEAKWEGSELAPDPRRNDRVKVVSSIFGTSAVPYRAAEVG
jgi:hypothetical protein